MDVVQNILRVAKAHKMTDQQLCRLLKTNPSKIYDWKKGKSKPSADDVLTIANYFGVSADYLLGREEKSHEESPQPPIESVSIHVDENGVEEAREQIIKIVDQMTPEEQTAYLNVLLSLLSWKSLQPKRQSVGA